MRRLSCSSFFTDVRFAFVRRKVRTGVGLLHVLMKTILTRSSRLSPARSIHGPFVRSQEHEVCDSYRGRKGPTTYSGIGDPRAPARTACQHDALASHQRVEHGSETKANAGSLTRDVGSLDKGPGIGTQDAGNYNRRGARRGNLRNGQLTGLSGHLPS